MAFFRAMEHLVVNGELRPVVRAFLIAKAFTGMRKGELQSLRRRQLDLADRRIVPKDTKDLKLTQSGSKSETVSLPLIATDVVAAILPPDGAPDDLVFPPKRG